MRNELTEKRIVEALQKQEGKPPRKIELGGGYYYKCYWVSCNEDLNKFFEYCPRCGTRIQWDREQEVKNEKGSYFRGYFVGTCGYGYSSKGTGGRKKEN